MKETARLIIPVWGEVYASKLVSITIPAILAPGNLPTLCEMFDVELVIVTELKLFESIRRSQSYQSAAKLCAVRLVSLDDLMTDIPGDYGVVLTYALHRGFTDLGARMTETYLLFLNADFIISDGSLGHVGKLMRKGKRVIHAPSFRVILEEVWPQLQARVDGVTRTLRLPPRELVGLALAHKHQTVKARTVNQRLYHQSWMDQYYWYVDEDTLIGYQWPVALVAIKPERVVTEPVLVWDYGFIPEASPTAERHFIDDSDDFFMIEPQSRGTGRSMIRLGWISFDDIARNLSMWTTKEQRECGRQLLKFHAADLPANLDEVIKESRSYMAEIYSRLTPTPLPHIGHSYLGPWFDGAKERMRGRQSAALASATRENAGATIARAARRKPRLAAVILGGLLTVYRNTFGSPPQVRKFHPLWIDSSPIIDKIAAWRESASSNILWLSASDSLFQRLLDGRVDPAALLVTNIRGSFVDKAPYGACLCELPFDDLSNLDRLYAAIRPLIKDGGQILVSVVNKNNMFAGEELVLGRAAFPSVDLSAIHFFGTAMTGLLRAIYMRASNSFPTRPIARALTVSAVLILLAPIVRLANARAAARDSAIFSRTWTSLTFEFTVKRGPAAQRAASRSDEYDRGRTFGQGNDGRAGVANGQAIC